MRILCLFIILSGYSLTQAQTEREILIQNTEKIVIEADYANLKIVTQNIHKVMLESEVNINDGKHNNRLILDDKFKKNTLYITSSIDDPQSIPKVKTVYDKMGNILSVEEVEGKRGNRYYDNYHGQGRIQIEQKIDVQHTLYVPEAVDITVKTTYGKIVFSGNVESPTSLSSTYAVIEAAPAQLDAPLAICSTYSSIDVSLPKTMKADVSMESQYGQFYTDLAMDVKDSRSDFKLLATYNGGGKPIYMESPYSNIYLRKL